MDAIMPTTTKPPLEKYPTIPPPSEATKEIETASTSNADTTSYVPSVLSLIEEPRHPTGPRIHILGDDLSSKYIAHAMSQIHEHVELLSWNPDERPRNIATKVPHKKGRPQWRVDANGAHTSGCSDSNSHIDQLVLTGAASQAVTALRKVEHRIDKNSTICLMSDGLGVLEDVRRQLFANRQHDEPNLLLGHMSHKITYNRKHNSIKEQKQGAMMITQAWGQRLDAQGAAEQMKLSAQAQGTLVEAMGSVPAFHSSWAEYDEWLRFKMPSVILGAVVEPTCVMFDSGYMDLLTNAPAFDTMHAMLEEILACLDHMHELQGSRVGDFIREPSQRTRILRRLISSKKRHPSPTWKMLKRGGYNDVNYLNGYFIRRGKQLGIPMVRNTMAHDIVKGLHQRRIQERDQWVDFEEKPLRVDQVSRWKPYGEETHWTQPKTDFKPPRDY